MVQTKIYSITWTTFTEMLSKKRLDVELTVIDGLHLNAENKV